jgi:DNA-binding CsgD family transcriptional regulator
MTLVEVSDWAYGSSSQRGELGRLPRLASSCPGAGPFPRRDQPNQPRELVGRDRDLAVIGAFVAELPARGGSLLLRGEPGVGKSALLDAAEAQAETANIRVLRAAGAEFEDASFFALNQLLLPLADDLDRLNDLQRAALDVALGFNDGPGCGRLVVSNAALTLLRQAAADRPLLLVVDDLHWVDQASAQVLGFVARRLRLSQAGLIAAERTGASRLSVLGAPGYEVRPLDDDAAALLVATRFPGLAHRVRQRIVTEARGNSLALLELPAGLSQQQRSARAALPEVLPLSGCLQAVLASRVAALPAAAGYLLLLAVLEGTGDLSLLRSAAGRQWEIGGLAPAVQAGVVHVDDAAQRVVFLHSGIRSAVLELAAGGDVRRAHLALAAQLRDQPERRAWHLAEADIDLGGEGASALAPVPRQPREPGDPDQARRLATAAYLTASVDGDLSAAETLLADARRACPGVEPSAESAFATAFVLLHGDGDVGAARRLLLPGLETVLGGDDGPLSAVQAVWLLVRVCQLSGRAEDREALDRFVACAGPAVPASVRAAVRGVLDPRTARGPLGGEIGSLVGRAEPAQIVRIARASACADRLADCRQALRRVARPEPAGRVGPVAVQASILLALEAYQTGQWDEAWRLAQGAGDWCASRGYQLLRQQAQTVQAFTAACRGDAGTAQALADDIALWAAPRGLTLLLAGARYARVLMALALSDFPTAYQQAARISPPGDIVSCEPFAAWALLDLVEGALRTGRHDDADAHVQAVRRAGLAATSPRMALLSAAAMAMTASDDEAPALFERALASEDAGRWPFDRARVQLLFGERLRRLRASGTARVHLSAALDEFRRLGAPTWADRAAMALRATGQVPPGAENRRHQVLTPHELQIAELAAAGLSNKEIGERLFMSHRTVASHLYRMFPRLGITSRAALGTVLPRDHD